MELEGMKPQNKIQDYIEKRKTEQSAKEQEEKAQKEKVKQKQAERKENLGKIANMASNAISTGASLIPHVATFALGLSADKLGEVLLQAIKDQRDKK